MSTLLETRVKKLERSTGTDEDRPLIVISTNCNPDGQNGDRQAGESFESYRQRKVDEHQARKGRHRARGVDIVIITGSEAA